MEVKHDASRQEFYVELEGHRAHVAYQIHDEGLDIRHTIVPEAIGGKGIASALVKAAYDYGRCKGLKAIAPALMPWSGCSGILNTREK